MNTDSLKQAIEIIPKVKTDREYDLRINNTLNVLNKVHEIMAKDISVKDCGTCEHDPENNCCEVRNFSVTDFAPYVDGIYRKNEDGIYVISTDVVSQDIQDRVNKILQDSPERSIGQCIYLDTERTECVFGQFKPIICRLVFCNKGKEHENFSSDAFNKAVKMTDGKIFLLDKIFNKHLPNQDDSEF